MQDGGTGLRKGEVLRLFKRRLTFDRVDDEGLDFHVTVTLGAEQGINLIGSKPAGALV